MSGGLARRLLHFFWFGYQRRAGDDVEYLDSNSEIQKWGERCLERDFAVHSASCVSNGRVTVRESDILVGHPTWDPEMAGGQPRTERDWVRDNRVEPTAPAHPNTYILMPWVPAFPSEWTRHMPWYEAQLEHARLIFAICGGIWIERTRALADGSVQSRVREKLVRLNMCVNFRALGPVKARFNPRGRRRVVHVSNLGRYKGMRLLLESTAGVTLPSIGSLALKKLPQGETPIEIDGARYPVMNLGAVRNHDHAQIAKIVEEHDFYLHTASMDAQATTILEFAGRGLIPIVTPESGFDAPEAIYLTGSAARNRDIIRDALDMPEQECRERSAALRARIEKEHGWDRFYATIAEHIRATCAG